MGFTEYSSVTTAIARAGHNVRRRRELYAIADQTLEQAIGALEMSEQGVKAKPKKRNKHKKRKTQNKTGVVPAVASRSDKCREMQSGGAEPYLRSL